MQETKTQASAIEAPPLAPLETVSADLLAMQDKAKAELEPAILLTFNRVPTEQEVRMYQRLPAVPTVLHDLQTRTLRMEAAELVARLFQFYVLGNIVLPDTPAAMDWLKSYLNGDGHGPLGGPMRWPGMIASAHNLLTKWGYAPSAQGLVSVTRVQPDQVRPS